MPIRQEDMIAQMQEARAAHQYGRGLRDMMLNYFDMAQRRFAANTELCDAITALSYQVRNMPVPDDRTTYVNEQHYRKRAKINDAMRHRQEIARRMAGIPTQEEALAILHAKNALRRADLPADPDAYQPAPIPNGLADPFLPRAKPSRPNIIFPRDDPDDLPLDFEGEASDSLFAKPKEEG